MNMIVTILLEKQEQGGPQLNFKDIEPILLKFNNTKITGQPVELDYDQTSKNFLHPVAGSEAAKIG